MIDKIIRGSIVVPDRVLDDGYVGIVGERIACIGQGEPPPALELIDARGSIVLPGVIDAQVHAGSVEGFPGLRDATRAAAAGGVTTIIDMPFDHPEPVSNVERLHEKITAIGSLAAVDVALYVTPPLDGSKENLASLIAAGACGVKVSTYEYNSVRFPRHSNGQLFELFRHAADLCLRVAFHNEDQELVAHLLGQARGWGGVTASNHHVVRPILAETLANIVVVEIAAATGAACHIVHTSHPDAIWQVGRARERGVDVTVETCLHYLVFSSDDVADQGTRLKLNPPIRSAEEREALWGAVLAGKIDLVSSDHVAWPLNKKSDPNFENNGSGAPGLETLLIGFYTEAVERRGMSLPTLARQLSERPARHFGLFPRKGALMPGADADIAVIRTHRHSYEESSMRSDVKWSPYNGRIMEARVEQTIVRGNTVYLRDAEDGFLHGRLVRPRG